jgi:hypothetical protein
MKNPGQKPGFIFGWSLLKAVDVTDIPPLHSHVMLGLVASICEVEILET